MESAHAMRPLQHIVHERTGHDEPLASAQGLHRIVHGMGGLGRVGVRAAVFVSRERLLVSRAERL